MQRQRLLIVRMTVCAILQSLHVCRGWPIRRVAHMSTTSTFPEEVFPKVVLRRNKQSRSFREGSPLVFSGSIAYTQSKDVGILPLGCLVAVHVEQTKAVSSQNNKKSSSRDYPHLTSTADDATQLIGYGVYNPYSMYRIRILCHATTHGMLMEILRQSRDVTTALSTILRTNLRTAIQLRGALDLPRSDTDTFRLVNGEGDCLSGLAIDIIGGTVAVCMSSAAWCEVHETLILSVLKEALLDPSLDIIWKRTPSRLEQDGITSETQVENGDVVEDDTTMVVAKENGIEYETYPYATGQKTGVYCDQRENRLFFSSYCRDKRVLDLCCYHGGFSLNAILHGKASHVVCVDSSQYAIDICKANAQRNKCDTNNVEFVRDDISNFMKEALERGDAFDAICLDPPKLAPTVSGLDRASRKYHGLNRNALKLISSSGGLFMTCTCSAAMSQKDGGQYFLNTIQQAAIAAGRHITLLRVNGAASCHAQNPASRSAYLTAALFYVCPSE